MGRYGGFDRLKAGEIGRKTFELVNRLLCWLDSTHLWPVGFVFLAVNLLPCLYLGKGSVFPFHDQLDETILSYVLNAKYFGTGAEIFPELLGGISASGMQPAAVLFVPLYRIFPVFTAFLIQWTIVLASAFFGMYFCVKELTGSSVLAVTAAGFFCMLPAMPVYGLSTAGVPLLICTFLWLRRREHRVLSFVLILFFGLTTHLVLMGYVVLALWGAAILWLLFRDRGSIAANRRVIGGFLWLSVIYLAVNRRLFSELILGNRSYVSHREELVNQSSDFWETVKRVFLSGAQHAESLHRYLILPVFLLLAVGVLAYRTMEKRGKIRCLSALCGMALLMLIAVFYAFCQWEPVVEFKNSRNGFLHYFQAERFYWLYPAGWYLEFFLCFSLWWNDLLFGGRTAKYLPRSRVVKLLVLAVVLLPTYKEVKENSYLYMNVNQINNGSGVTGYISWESYYAEDLMQELETAIGQEMGSYRVAHLGMSPAPALMHGFYTADGYSNNYPLEYKHRFRQVIAAELEKNEQTKLYFDQWGSRCYLFNGTTGNAWMIGKTAQVIYEELDFDMETLKNLDCQYLFSCGVIENADQLGLGFMGYYETEDSYWGVWLYKL